MFNLDHAKRIQDDVMRALKAVELKHGIRFEIGRAAVGETIHLSLECARSGLGNRPFKKEVLDFRQFADGYGLRPDVLGRTFMVRGVPYQILGLNISAPKYPILGKCKKTGRMYRFSAETVSKALATTT